MRIQVVLVPITSYFALFFLVGPTKAFTTPSITSTGKASLPQTAQQVQVPPHHKSHTSLHYQANATLDVLAAPPLTLDQLVASATTSSSVSSSSQEELTKKKKSLVTTTTSTTTQNDNSLSDVNKARLLLLGAAALYGTNFSLVKILGETGMSVGLSSTLRFGMAAVATLPWLLKLEEDSDDGTTASSKNRLQQLFRRDGVEFQAAMGGLEVGMWNSIGYVAQAVGLETTSASKSAFLCSLAVVMVPILDYLAGKTLLSRQVLGAMLAVMGVGFLELDGGAGMGSLQDSLSGGDIASLVQPVAFGLGFWRMEAAMSKFPEQADRATAAQLLAVFLGSGLYMSTMAVVDPSTFPTTDQFVAWITDPTILGALFWTGVVTTAMTIYMETLALKTLSAAETTLIFSTEPLWGTAFASTVMGETLGLNAVAGAVLILSGCVFSNLGFQGLASFLPWRSSSPMNNNNNNSTERAHDAANLERLEFLDDTPIAGQNLLPANAWGKLSLKSAVVGALTGVVALVETASASPPTVEPEELQEIIIDHLSSSSSNNP